MKKKFKSSNIDYSPYSQPLNNNNNQNYPKNRNTITTLQPRNSKNNFFPIYKDYESNPNHQINNNNNKIINSLNEKIYSNNSKKLGEYYTKNKEDISLYGSKKYDLLTVDNLVQEMKQYRNSIIEKMKQNPSKFKLKNYGLKNSNANLILTPLAEKERSKMGNNEKELFNLAERRGVVMRRIEYSNSLNYNDNDNLNVFLIMKNAVKLIEKCWKFYKGLKIRKYIKGIICVQKFIKRKILRLFNDINNERLKNIYMNNNNNSNNNNIIITNSNFSSISFKNGINLKNSNLSNNSNINSNINERYISQDKKKFEICSGDILNIISDININMNNNKLIDELQKKYYKLILDYKMLQKEINKHKNENTQLKNQINILTNENKELNKLKNENSELIKKFDELNINYNNLLKDFDTLNINNSNLFNNQSLLFNSFKKDKNIIPIKETDEYITLQNEYNLLKDKYNKIFSELDEMKRNNEELKNLIIKNNEIKNSYVPIDEETINEINEYKNKIEELNSQLLKQKNDYEERIDNLNKNLDNIKTQQIQQVSVNINKSENIDYINQIKTLENKIKNYETQIKQCNTKIKEKEELLKSKDKNINNYNNKIKNFEKIITENKNKEIELIKKMNEYEQKINLTIKNKQEIDNINNINIKLNETQKKLNSYIINNNKLTDENSKNKNQISKLNNLIIGLNQRIKQLLEENKNLRENIKSYKSNNNNKNIINNNKLFLLYLEKIITKKIFRYKYQLMVNLFQENINNFTKYVIFQNNSVRSSLNLDGYEKVITGESKKIITKENEENNVTYNNKIIIHKDLDDTLKNYIIKGKDNLTFDEIFEDEKRNNLNNNNDKNIF